MFQKGPPGGPPKAGVWKDTDQDKSSKTRFLKRTIYERKLKVSLLCYQMKMWIKKGLLLSKIITVTQKKKQYELFPNTLMYVINHQKFF